MTHRAFNLHTCALDEAPIIIDLTSDASDDSTARPIIIDLTRDLDSDLQ
jgi:hypothetical protein